MLFTSNSYGQQPLKYLILNHGFQEPPENLHPKGQVPITAHKLHHTDPLKQAEPNSQHCLSVAIQKL